MHVCQQSCPHISFLAHWGPVFSVGLNETVTLSFNKPELKVKVPAYTGTQDNACLQVWDADAMLHSTALRLLCLH